MFAFGMQESLNNDESNQPKANMKPWEERSLVTFIVSFHFSVTLPVLGGTEIGEWEEYFEEGIQSH